MHDDIVNRLEDHIEVSSYVAERQILDSVFLRPLLDIRDSLVGGLHMHLRRETRFTSWNVNVRRYPISNYSLQISSNINSLAFRELEEVVESSPFPADTYPLYNELRDTIAPLNRILQDGLSAALGVERVDY